jgi:hypothetical protein
LRASAAAIEIFVIKARMRRPVRHTTRIQIVLMIPPCLCCVLPSRRALPIVLAVNPGLTHHFTMLLTATFNPAIEHPGGCFTCRYFGVRLDVAVWSIHSGREHVRSQAARGCAFWEREPGTDD